MRVEPNLIDNDILYRAVKYCENCANQQKLAEEIGCTQVTLIKKLKLHHKLFVIEKKRKGKEVHKIIKKSFKGKRFLELWDEIKLYRLQADLREIDLNELEEE